MNNRIPTRIAPILSLVLCVLTVSTAQSQTVRTIDPSGRWVTDAGDFLDRTEESLLDRKLASYADSTSSQIVVVTVKDLGGYDAQEYALAIGRNWRVGQEGKNNGVVILLSRDERAVRIETGYGMEATVPDILAGKIVRDVMIPSFKAGDFFGGLNTAVDIIIAAASGEFDADQIAEQRSEPINPIFIYFLIMFIYFVLSGIRNKGKGGGGRRHNRYNTLPIIFWGSGMGHGRSGGFGGGGGGFGGGFGGFGGGGGGFGGGGAGGSW